MEGPLYDSNAHSAAGRGALGIPQPNVQGREEEEEFQREQAQVRVSQAVSELALVGDRGTDVNAAQQQQRVLSSPDDQGRMQLSKEEHQHALQIKDTLDLCPDLGAISDYWCAQLALDSPDNVDSAIEKIEHLQAFRETYGIIDTWEFGCKCLKEYQKLCPNHLLSITFSPQHGCYVFVTDLSKVDVPAIRRSPDGLDIWLRCLYFVVQAMCCDLGSIRTGAVVMHECHGHGVGGMDFKTLRHAMTHLINFYPFQLKCAKYFHSGVTMNLIVSMLRPFLPKRRRKKLMVGCQHEQTLDAICNQPTPEAAEARVLRQFAEMLQRRYRNEANFSLE